MNELNPNMDDMARAIARLQKDLSTMRLRTLRQHLLTHPPSTHTQPRLAAAIMAVEKVALLIANPSLYSHERVSDLLDEAESMLF